MEHTSPLLATEANSLAFRTLLKESWRLLWQGKTRFLQILTPVFVIAGVEMAAALLLVFFALPPLFAEIMFVFTGVLGLGAGLWVGASLLYALKTPELSGKEALKTGFRNIFLYGWVAVLTGFLIIGGSFLLIVPGILFAIWFSFSLYALVLEDFKGMNALFRSKQLVEGHWWRVLLLFLGLGIVEVLVLVPFVVLTAGVFIGVAFLFTLSTETVELLFRPFETLFNWATLLFSAVFLFFLYQGVRQAKGNPAFLEPGKGRKIKYIAIGTLGFIVVGMLSFWLLISKDPPNTFPDYEPSKIRTDISYH